MRRIMIVMILVFTILLSSNDTETIKAKIKPSNESSLDLIGVPSFQNVVIFIRFQDESTYSAPYDLNHYENLFNGIDTSSLRDYYLEVSYNQLLIESYLVKSNDSIIYYNDIYDRNYYEPYSEDNPNGYTEFTRKSREDNLLKHAVEFVDDNYLVPDTLNLDSNNDGDVDSITFIISGEAIQWSELLWPHKSDLLTFFDKDLEEYTSDAPLLNGLNAFNYTFEFLGNSTTYEYQVSVPIVAHEIFHLIGAPDLYHYFRYDWIEAVGDWDLMDNVSFVPSHMLGYMKYQYGGWIDTVDEITASGTYTLYPLQDSPNNLYVINTGHDNEYVYLEYRDQVGKYEFNTPDSGLIIYRVDLDYHDEGNVQGYYLEDGLTVNEEVFVFRPGIEDTIPLITFSPINRVILDEDGSIEDAALSQNNLYNEMGLGTDIVMFYSDGTLMNITIKNVVEHDGYITFEVILNAPEIKIICDYSLGKIEDVHFIDAPYTYYSIEIDNFDSNLHLYYTLDGTNPTLDSSLYNGREIEITKELNHIKAILVDENGYFIAYIEQSFDFVSDFETDDINYRDNIHEYWLLQFRNLTTFSIYFDEEFRLSDINEYIKMHSSDSSLEYTDRVLADTRLHFDDYGLMIEYVAYAANFFIYGFRGELYVDSTADEIEYYLNGDNIVYVEVDGYFVDDEITIFGNGSSTAYVEKDNLIDIKTTGEYLVTYYIYNDRDRLVGSISRTVVIQDTSIPQVYLNASLDSLYIGDIYVEQGITVVDKTPFKIEITGYVNIYLTGTYIITYTVTDESGNKASISRYVVVSEEIPVFILGNAPTSIQVGEKYRDGSCMVLVGREENECDIKENNINKSISGIYSITYSFSSGGKEYTHKRYVFVYDGKHKPTLYFKKEKESDWL